MCPLSLEAWPVQRSHPGTGLLVSILPGSCLDHTLEEQLASRLFLVPETYAPRSCI